MGKKLSKSLDTITKELDSDKEFRIGWTANIAMAFKDEYHRYVKKHKKKHINRQDLHTIANTAAEDFIKLLCK